MSVLTSELNVLKDDQLYYNLYFNMCNFYKGISFNNHTNLKHSSVVYLIGYTYHRMYVTQHDIEEYAFHIHAFFLNMFSSR